MRRTTQKDFDKIWGLVPSNLRGDDGVKRCFSIMRGVIENRERDLENALRNVVEALMSKECSNSTTKSALISLLSQRRMEVNRLEEEVRTLKEELEMARPCLT